MDEERLVVSKVRSFAGIYIATLRLGYRDPIDLSNVHGQVRDCIVELERACDPVGAGEKVRLIDRALERSVTHMLVIGLALGGSFLGALDLMLISLLLLLF